MIKLSPKRNEKKMSCNQDVKRIIDSDSHVKEMWEKCKEYGIVADIEKRWEYGIEHHPEAIDIFNLIKKSDWIFGGDYFVWKEGGDGDNGEILMYALSVMLELRDKMKF